MKGRRFRIPTLALAGFLVNDAQAAPASTAPSDVDAATKQQPSLFDVFRQDHAFTLAGHRSHSSHSSHRSSSGGGSGHSSHSSHRSSTGGGGAVRPAPLYSPPVTRNRDSTPPATVLPSSPATAPKARAVDAEPFKEIVRRVQIGLLTRGYYSGAIDGIVGPETRASLLRFQADYGLTVTGTVTPEVLDAFAIAAR